MTINSTKFLPFAPENLLNPQNGLGANTLTSETPTAVSVKNAIQTRLYSEINSSATHSPEQQENVQKKLKSEEYPSFFDVDRSLFPDEQSEMCQGPPWPQDEDLETCHSEALSGSPSHSSFDTSFFNNDLFPRFLPLISILRT